MRPQAPLRAQAKDRVLQRRTTLKDEEPLNGTYVDPTLPSPLSGEAIAKYVAGLVAAFPDLTFVVEEINVDGHCVTLQWRMQGTKHGTVPGGIVAHRWNM